MLSNISKKIIITRLYDKGITAIESDFDNYLIDTNKFSSNNEMYDFIVNNYGSLIIE